MGFFSNEPLIMNMKVLCEATYCCVIVFLLLAAHIRV